jgi:CHASE3 domain sensor protein/putative methionine-R-sulfoxide reductase with GAF domain
MQIKAVNKFTLVGFSILSLLTLISVYFAVHYRNVQVNVLNMQHETVVQSYRLKVSSEKRTNTVMSFLNTGNIVYYNEYINEAKIERSINQAVENLKALGTTTPQEFALIEEANRNSDKLMNLEIQALDSGKNGKIEMGRRLIYGQHYQDSVSRIMKPIAQFQEQIEKRLSEKVKESNTYANTSLIIAFMMMCLTTLSIVLIQFLFYGKRVVLPLVDLNNCVINLIEEKGNEEPIDLHQFNHQNEIGSLALSIMNFHHAVVSANKAQQLRQHIMEIIAELRATDNFYDLANAFMLNANPLLGVLHGLFYIAHDDTQTLKLIGGYGVAIELIGKDVNFNEGLVGQCASEKRTIRLDNPPADYLQISSGVGSAKPSCILIIPLLLNNRLLGVLELCTFKHFNEREMAILSEIEPILATHIETISYKTGSLQHSKSDG